MVPNMNQVRARAGRKAQIRAFHAAFGPESGRPIWNPPGPRAAPVMYRAKKR